MKNNLKKNFIWNLIGSTFNSFTSLFFLIIVARINGLSDAGIFTFAFANACFLQVIGIYATRAYQVTEKNKNITDNDYVNTKILTSILMIVISMVFCLIKGYTTVKVIVIILLTFYKALDAFSESIYAIIQKNDRLYQVGISLFLKGIIGTFIFLITNILTNNMIFSIIVLIISNILIILLYDFPKVKLCDYKLEKINLNSCKIIIKVGFWTFLFTFLTQYLINAPKYAIDNNLGNDMQTIYGIISMPATIMILISNFIIHPFLLKISDTISKKAYDKLNALMLKMLLSIILIGIIGLIGTYFLGIPVLNILYNISLDDYKFELLIIILGATIFALTIIISNVLIALRKTMSQSIIFVITSILTFIFSNILVKKLSVLGASYSYLLSMIILLILYIIVYIYIINKEKKMKNNIHTFVVLAYKESNYLEECIKSVLDQEVKSNVIIATSTPNTFIDNLAKKYNLNVKVNKGKKGIGYDFDFAVNSANTKLVTVAHQDDIYDKNYSKEVIDAYNKQNKSIIIFPDYYEIRNGINTYKNLNLNIKKVLLFPLRFHKISNRKFIKRSALRFGDAISCPAVTFVKDNVPKEIFASDLKCNIDWYAWEKLSKLYGYFYYINKPLMGHRIYGGSTTTEIINDNKRTIEDFQILCKFWPKWIAKIIAKLYSKSEASNNVK